MRTVVYKCDRCGAEDNNNKIGLAEVSITINGNSNIMRSYNNSTIQLKQDWCALCRVELGLADKYTVGEEDRKKLRPVEATLEDLIRELAREEAVNVYKELT